MIRVRLWTEEGRLTVLESTGHAVRPAGGDSVPCAAVSAILYSTGRSFAERKGCVVEGSAPESGLFMLRIRAIEESDRHWAEGVTDMVVEALSFIAREYRDDLEFTVMKE